MLGYKNMVRERGREMRSSHGIGWVTYFGTVCGIRGLGGTGKERGKTGARPRVQSRAGGYRSCTEATEIERGDRRSITMLVQNKTGTIDWQAMGHLRDMRLQCAEIYL
jgi:hypothetical protein